MSEPIHNPRLEAALDYAERGIPVLPCCWIVNGACSCGNLGCSSPGKHPLNTHGLTKATIDDGQIKRWWRQWPNANIGGRMGEASKLVAVDVDPRNGGDRSFDYLQDMLGELPEQAPLAQTGGGGRHVFFAYPAGGLAKKQGLLDGIDVQAEGSYVLLEPSRTVGDYKFLVPLNEGAPPLPEAWLNYIRSGKKKEETAEDKPNETIPQGRRNAWLTSEAGKLRRSGFGQDVMFAALRVLNLNRCEPPLAENEVRTICHSVSQYTPEAKTVRGVGSSFDDIGNAARLVSLHGSSVRYVDKWGCWLTWNGTSWTEDAKAVRVNELAKDVSRSWYRELATGGYDDKKAGWARQSALRARIEAAVSLSRGIEGVLISHDQLDSDPHALGVANGFIDLKTGTFHEPDPARLMTLQSPVGWDPDADCPRWLAALMEWFPSDEARDYVQRLVGQAIVGTIQDHIFVIFYGDGSNGKGTFIRALIYVLGPYAVSIDLSLLVETKYPAHDSATSVLFRKRLAVASETSRRVRLAEASIKNLTGGDKIPARRLYENPWEFEPTHTLWLQTNYLPEISGRDRGVWRRIRVVPWTAHFKRNKDENLDDLLRGEAPGILRWCVEAVRLYLKSGLDEPQEVLDATKAYRAREDIVGRWMTECGFIFDAELKIEANQLTNSWQEWGASQFGKPRRFHEVAQTLEGAGCTKYREGLPKVTWWKGIGIESD